MITAYPANSYIEVDGTKYVVERKVAQLAQLLIQANGDVVQADRLVSALGTTMAAVYVYTGKFRAIAGQHGYKVRNAFRVGWRLEAPAKTP